MGLKAPAKLSGFGNQVTRSPKNARCLACGEILQDSERKKMARVRFPTYVQPKVIHAYHEEDSDGTVRPTAL
jgi:hypothetical protein